MHRFALRCSLPAAFHGLCGVIGLARSASLPEERYAVREAKLQQAICYIDRHLSDFTLAPARAAIDLGICVRALHYLFEPTGTSFADYVTRRRLQECRAILENGYDTQSVTRIALAWGFGSLATFYRAFQREYGVSPGDVRAKSKARGTA